VDRINPPRPPQRRRSAVLAAAGAFVLGVLYAAISGYWGSGGTALLASVGGVFQRAGRNGSVAVLAVVWLTVLLKLLAASLGVVVVAGEPRIDVRRRRQLRMVSWAAASVLVIYGGVLSIIGWLAQIGIVSAGHTQITRRFAGTPTCGTHGFWSGACCWPRRCCARVR
jgi:hypothetical protein